jgi:hypothetical protein
MGEALVCASKSAAQQMTKYCRHKSRKRRIVGVTIEGRINQGEES